MGGSVALYSVQTSVNSLEEEEEEEDEVEEEEEEEEEEAAADGHTEEVDEHVTVKSCTS